MSKILKFVKENKIIVFALAVIVLSFIFLALPGQFARYGIGALEGKHYEWKYQLSGYQFIFNKGKDILGNPIGTKVVGQGVVIIVFLAVCVPGLLVSNKTSFFTMLTGLLLVATSILFFTISKAGHACYPYETPVDLDGNKLASLIKWVPYLLGSLIVIAGVLVVYKAVMMMKNEIKHPVASNKAPTYNYLKK